MSKSGVRQWQPSERVTLYPHTGLLNRELKHRARGTQLKRADTLGYLRGEFKEFGEVALGFEIFTKIAPDLDDMFIRQRKFDVIAKPMSWVECCADNDNNNPAVKLTDKIHGILGNTRYQEFFEKNDETRQILQILADKIPKEKDPDKLYNLVIELEKLAAGANSRGKLVFLCMMSQVYTAPDESDEKRPNILEADMRIGLPLVRKERRLYQKVADEAWDRLRAVSGHNPKKPKAVALVVETIGIAGAELESSTDAEGFWGNGVYIGINMLKVRHTDHDFYRRTKLRFPSVKAKDWLFPIITHEVGHAFFTPKGRLFDEMNADMAIIVAGLSAISGNRQTLGTTLEEFYHRVIVWAIQQANEVKSRKDHVDGYRLSGIYVLNKLMEAKVLKVNTGTGVIQLDLSDEGNDKLLAGVSKDYKSLIKEDGAPEASQSFYNKWRQKRDESLSEEIEYLTKIVNKKQWKKRHRAEKKLSIN